MNGITALLACAAAACASARPARGDEAELATDMADAAQRFLRSLPADQASAASFAADADERLDWHYIPRPRPGVSIGSLDDAPRALAYSFLATALGRRGLLKAGAIMALEDVLREREGGRGAYVRDAGAYYLSIFGEPSPTATWGWRLEGHHLSLNVTLVDGVHPIEAPAFFGAAPADSRVLGREEELGFRLLGSLDAAQRRAAITSDIPPEDILGVPGAALGELPGLSAGAMTHAQRAILQALLAEVLASLPHEVADRERARIASHAAVVFTWSGADVPTKPHYFRLSGPTFLYEYDNTQQDATHVHTVWHARGPAGGNFGIDLLREHHRHAHASPR